MAMSLDANPSLNLPQFALQQIRTWVDNHRGSGGAWHQTCWKHCSTAASTVGPLGLPIPVVQNLLISTAYSTHPATAGPRPCSLQLYSHGPCNCRTSIHASLESCSSGQGPILIYFTQPGSRVFFPKCCPSILWTFLRRTSRTRMRQGRKGE